MIQVDLHQSLLDHALIYTELVEKICRPNNKMAEDIVNYYIFSDVLDIIAMFYKQTQNYITQLVHISNVLISETRYNYLARLL